MTILYRPDAEQIARSSMGQFAGLFAERMGRDLPDYPALHAASIQHGEDFWSAVWDFTNVIGEKGRTVVEGKGMPGTHWFPDARLNFAENLLGTDSDELAITFSGEDSHLERLTRKQLRDRVQKLAQALSAAGVASGDRVAGYLPNLPDTMVAMLGAASIGAVWSSCSPDFGVAGVLDRFGQIEPKVLIFTDGYQYKGVTHDCIAKVRDIVAALPSVDLLIRVSFIDSNESVDKSVTLDEFIAPYEPEDFAFTRFPFSHPLYILYSSGTTGAPKCIVHSAGGTLLQHLKEHQLHCDIQPGDTLFYFTTCGWMMWNWLASGLASDAHLLLFDGNPFHPKPDALFAFIDKEDCRIFGTSAKYLEEVSRLGVKPRERFNFDKLDIVLSTGSPLSPDGFDFVYRDVKQNVQLSSISGGTDIVSCFVLGSPMLPVHRGEIQCAGLGMAVEIWNEAGERVIAEKGELVCTQPFPSVPIGFWNDPDDARYRAAYFESFPGVWHHGDFAEETANGGFVIHGRSDAILNPGGVRIGTAEIYRQLERIPEIAEAIVVGQQFEGDVRVVLFVCLQESKEFSAGLVDRIRQQIRANTTPRHVPARIVAVPDIPRTRSGKLVELAVRAVIHGETVTNRESIANPEALEHFVGLKELES